MFVCKTHIQGITMDNYETHAPVPNACLTCFYKIYKHIPNSGKKFLLSNPKLMLLNKPVVS